MARKIKYKYYIDQDFGTVATRNIETGKLTGRKKVSGVGDRTPVRRVSSPKRFAGEIIGRTSPISVRGDSTKRGAIRRRL